MSPGRGGIAIAPCRKAGVTDGVNGTSPVRGGIADLARNAMPPLRGSPGTARDPRAYARG